MKAVLAPLPVLGILLGCAGALHAQEPVVVEPARPSFLKTPRLFSEEKPESEGEERKDEIETDRDSFTPSTTTAGKRRLIFESGWTFLDNRGYKETNSLPEALFRFGLTERLELRLATNYEVGGVGSDVSGGTGGEEFDSLGKLERESTISYGFKYRLTEVDNWLPGSAFIVQAATPTSGNTTNTQLATTYVFGWELPYQMKLDSSFRYILATEEHDHFNEWAPSVVLKVPVGERINIHAEYFGVFSTNKAEAINHQYFSPGAHYLITENFEVGFRLGWGLNDQTPRFFSNIGVGLRF
ncbi:MAG: transporter [Gemmatales bacterium]